MKPASTIWPLAMSLFLTAPVLGKQRDATTAREDLERSSWFAEVSDELRRGEYRFSPVHDEDGVWSAPNRAHAFRSRVSATGLEVTPRNGDRCEWKLSLATTSFGRVDHTCELSAATVTVAQERVELDHGLLTEWFVNDERGLEQGWTIASRPNGVEPLWIGLEFGGDLSLRIDASARSGVLVDASGTVQLRYRDLLVFDATGRELNARLAPSAHGVGIEVDDAGAVYPLIVDPVLTGPAWTAESDQASAFLGWSVATAGDVNGDGYSDVIVGAYGFDNGQTDEGRAFVYLGSATGLATSPAWTTESNQANAQLGWSGSIATAGDVNGDGYSDVIVGAFLFDNGETNEGQAAVYLGSATGLAVSPAWTAESNQAGGEFGKGVTTAGEVNGDGYSDVIVGAPSFDNGQSNEGRAFVYLGSASGLATSPAWTAESNQSSANFGTSVAPAGDVNDDGFGDVIVGSPGSSNGQGSEGRAFVYLGSAAGLGTSAAWTAESNQSSAQLGFSVSTAGDVNGDGYGDVIVGAWLFDNGQTDEGRAFVYLGSASGLATSAAWTAESDQAGAYFGMSVSTAGDVNGDGYTDVLVGAPPFSNGQSAEGRAFVYLGSAMGLATGAAWTAESDQAIVAFGQSVATAGDVNGDGYGDVIVGAPLFDSGQADEGRAFVYMGSALGLGASSAWTADSPQTDAFLGSSVATAGDVNGDGFSDVIVGAPLYLADQFEEGQALVYLGSAAGLARSAAWAVEGYQSGIYFGASVAAAGDVNGDGYGDVIVGAPAYTFKVEEFGYAFVYLGSSTGLATSPAWTAVDSQPGSDFGDCVASAGDVNGDGYGDVIVGARAHSDDELAEGRVHVYLGSSTGLSANPAWTVDGDQSLASLGSSAASAGDLNGDGYSDVIVGAIQYDDGELDEGRALVYLGSATGLATSAAWSAASDQASAYFGHGVASAGDVNGDGYSDVIVGATGFDSGEVDEGRTFVYLGSAAGLALSAAWTAESNQAGARFGAAVATASDVNGDGYSDVIVGAWSFDNGQSDEGRAFAYLGSASGLALQAAWTAESDQVLAGFGNSVATAGDVNGDGYGDVIVGAPAYDADGVVEADEGRVYVYLGNEGRGGWTLAPQQRRASNAAPIALLGRSANQHEFRLRLGFERALAAFTWASGVTPKARLEWEIAPLRAPLDGSRIESGAEQTITGSPLVFDELVEVASPALVTLPFGVAQRVAAGVYHWRARIRTNNPLFPVTPWVTLPWNNVTETKLRVGPMPVAPVLR
ncbi:MAG: integrin alpha [Planctomycetota bacterium]